MEKLEALDIGSLYWFPTMHRPWLTPIMVGLSRLGDGPTVVAMATVLAVVFWLRGLPWTAGMLVLSTLAGILLDQVAKPFVNRPRPDVVWVLEDPKPTTPSFPSRHALNAMATYAAAAFLAARHVRSLVLRGFLIGSGLLLPFAIGVSRIYVGVHFLTDVVGGWSAGLACALLAVWADRLRSPSQTPRAGPHSGPFVIR